jgi:hypothetical protein
LLATTKTLARFASKKREERGAAKSDRTTPGNRPKAQKRPRAHPAPSGPEKTMEGGRRRIKRDP